MLQAEVYPLAFIWRTDFWSTLTNLLNDALRQRRPEGVLDAAKDFMLDRLDDTLEPIARLAGGKRIWDEMKENALLSSLQVEGGVRLLANELRNLCDQLPNVELHIAAHSAGSILMAPLAQLLTSKGAIQIDALKAETGLLWSAAQGMNLRLKTCTLWAAACTTALFEKTYLLAIAAGHIDKFTLFNLKDKIEQNDHCASIYNKSLLYLVSNALEKKLRSPFKKNGEPILGMDKFAIANPALQALITQGKVDYVLAPNEVVEGSAQASKATHHGSFDDDAATVKASLARILGREVVSAELTFARSAAAMRDKRKAITSA